MDGCHFNPFAVRTQVEVTRTPMAKFLPSESMRTTVSLPCMTAQSQVRRLSFISSHIIW